MENMSLQFASLEQQKEYEDIILLEDYLFLGSIPQPSHLKCGH